MSETTTVLEHVVANSGQLTTWALSVAGASVLAIVSTSYRRPARLPWRLPYLIFVPGWMCIAFSLYRGHELIGHFLASIMVSPTLLRPISQNIHNAYDDQRAYLLYGLTFFGIWLSIYLLTWVFHGTLYKQEGKE
jgi:hypothetical protein